MAPEADSGPDVDRHDRAGALPKGWVRLGPGGLMGPDPSSPLYPRNQLRRAVARVRKRLISDPEIMAVLDELAARFDAARLLAHRALSPTGEDGGNDAFYNEMLAAVQSAASRSGPPDVQEHVKVYFLVEQLFSRLGASADAVAGLRPRLEPVALFAQDNGDFLMTFRSATWRERKAFDKLITEAQRYFGFGKDAGAAEPREEDPERAGRDKTAAKLHHWSGWSYDEIAAFFGWEGAREARRERVRVAVRSGERLMSESIGPGWDTNPPPTIAERGR